VHAGFPDLQGPLYIDKSIVCQLQLYTVGTGVFGEDMVNDIVRVFGNIFLIAFKISAPITISIMISEVALGIVSKNSTAA